MPTTVAHISIWRRRLRRRSRRCSIADGFVGWAGFVAGAAAEKVGVEAEGDAAGRAAVAG
jgi:hypothetical protein